MPYKFPEEIYSIGFSNYTPGEKNRMMETVEFGDKYRKTPLKGNVYPKEKIHRCKSRARAAKKLPIVLKWLTYVDVSF
jgi:hypothetical protein